MTYQLRILERIEALRASGETFCIATIVRTADATSAKAGAKAVVSVSGELEGFVGGSCVTSAVKRAATDCIDKNVPRMIRVKPSDTVEGPVDDDGTTLYSSGCPSGGTVDVFLEPMRSQPRLIICGVTPIALALRDVVQSIGRQCVLVANAADLASLENITNTSEGFDLATLSISSRDAVIVVTQGNHDRVALQAALLSPADYVGMVGSHKKIAWLKQQLSDAVPQARIAELHGPAGLAIGAIAPEEIALSIVAQIVSFSRRDSEYGAIPNSAQTAAKA